MQLGGAAAYIDLERNARSLEGLANWWAAAPEERNLVRVAAYQETPLKQVAEAIDSAPGEFAGATDLVRGQQLLRSALSHLTQSRAEGTATDVSVAHISAAASDVRTAHGLLGGRREVPDFDYATPVEAIPAFEIADDANRFVNAKVGVGQKFGRGIMKNIVAPVVGLRVYGADNVPAEGGAIIAAMHQASYDPAHVLGGVSRTVRFVANKKLWNNAAQGWLIQKGGAIPIEPGNAEESLTIFRKLLQKGKLTAIYPEGMLVKGQLLGPHGDGAAKLSLQMNVPIVPSAIAGPKSIAAEGDPGGRRLRAMAYGTPIHPNGAPATADNIILMREKESRAQDSLFSEMQDKYLARRARSKARVKYWVGGTIATTAVATAAGVKSRS